MLVRSIHRRRRLRVRSHATEGNGPLASDRRTAFARLYASCSSKSSDEASRRETSAAREESDPEMLRIGIVGLGAIGTIFFSKLGSVAISNARAVSARERGRGEREAPPGFVPRVAVDAFVKPQRFQQLFDTPGSTPEVALHETLVSQGRSESVRVLQSIPFVDKITDGVAGAAVEGAHVRIRALVDSGERRIVRVDDEEQLDVVLLAVKAYDSASVVRELQRKHAHLFKNDALFVLLQNGLGELPDEVVSKERDTEQGSWRFANGVTYVGGRVVSFGNVVVSGVGSGMTFLAPVVSTGDGDDYDRVVKRIDLLGRVLTAAGCQWKRLGADEMKAMLWKKLIVNAGVNPIASILDAPNKSVGACEWSRNCVKAVVHEAFQVATSEQVALGCTEEELVQEVLQVATNTGTNVCSMLADLRNGSRTEIEAITGKIVSFGQRHGVPTPANDLLFQLIKALETQQTRSEDL